MAEARSLPATPQRLARARRAGLRPVGRDLPAALGVATAVAFGIAVAQPIAHSWRGWWRTIFEVVAQPHMAQVEVAGVVGEWISGCCCLLALVWIATTIGWLLQGGVGFASQRERAQLASVSTRGAQVGWAMAKAGVLSLAFVSVAQLGSHAAVAAPVGDLPFALRTLQGLGGLLLSRVGLALGLLVLADLVVAHALWRASLRMTRRELERELRESHGDASMGAERQRQRRELRGG